MKKELFELEAEKQNREEKEVELQCQMLKLLLNPKITSFNFPRGLYLETNQPLVTELWQSLVAEQPPDLHTQLLRLTHFECTDPDLINISENLPRLR